MYIIIFINYHSFKGFPGSSDGKDSGCNAEDLGSIPARVRRGKWQPTPVLLPGKSSRSPTLQADSLPSELPGKPLMLNSILLCDLLINSPLDEQMSHFYGFGYDEQSL